MRLILALISVLFCTLASAGGPSGKTCPSPSEKSCRDVNEVTCREIDDVTCPAPSEKSFAGIISHIDSTVVAQENSRTPHLTTSEFAIRAGGDWLTSVGHRSSFTQPDALSGTIEIMAPVALDNGFARAFNRPSFGIGFSFIDQSSTQLKSCELGDIYALYALMHRDLARFWRIRLGYDLAFGGAYTSEIFDPFEARGNWFFGSHLVVYARASTYASIAIAPHLQLVADATLMHGSNGRLAYPNLGLNYAGGGVSLRYDLSETMPNQPWRVPRSEYSRGWNFDVQLGGGVHTCGTEWVAIYNYNYLGEKPLEKVRLKRWPKASLSFDAMYRLCGRMSLGVMADAFYSSNAARLEEYDRAIFGNEAVSECPGYDPLSFGIGLMCSVHYGNVALTFAEGRYLYRRMGIRDDHGPMYSKFGFRYFSPRTPLFYAVQIKAQPFKAEYIDFSIGLRFGC